MSEGIKTVQGGGRRVPKTPPPTPKWIWPVIGLIVGIITLIIWQQCSVPVENELKPTPVSLEFETSPDLKVFPVKDNDTLPWKNIRFLRLLNSSDEVAFDRETGEVFLCAELAGLTVVFKAVIAVDGDEEEVESKSVKLGSFKQDDRAICEDLNPGFRSEDIVIVNLGNCKFRVDVVGLGELDVCHVGLNGPLNVDLRRDEYSLDELLDRDKWNIFVSINHDNPVPAAANGEDIERQAFGCKRILTEEERQRSKKEQMTALTRAIADKQRDHKGRQTHRNFINSIQSSCSKRIDLFTLYVDGEIREVARVSVEIMNVCQKAKAVTINVDCDKMSIHLKRVR